MTDMIEQGFSKGLKNIGSLYPDVMPNEPPYQK
jgi:hypothetical protein